MGENRSSAGGTLTDSDVMVERRQELARRPAIIVLAALLIQFLALGAVQAWNDALTVDEGVYLASGVTALTRHDLRLNPEQAPLSKVVAALPALAVRPQVPSTEAWDENRWFDYTDDFVSANDQAGTLRSAVFAGRVVPLLLAALTGVLAYLVAARLVGRLPGLAAAGAWLTTPFVVGLGHLNATDVPFAAATLMATLALVVYIDDRSDRRALLVGAAAGLVLLTRHAGLALVAGIIVAVIVAGRESPRVSVRHAVLVGLVAFGAVWVGVRVIAPSPPGGQARVQLEAAIATAERQSGVARVLVALPFPLEYRAGLAYLTLTDDDRPAYLLGEAWTGGRWWYWPASMAVKLPPSALALAAVGVAGLVVIRRRSRDRVLLAVALPAAIITGAVMAQPRNIGLRYLLPVLALGAVAAAGAVVSLRRRWGPWFLSAVAVTQLAFLWTSHPHSLAWTSPLFRPGYRYTSESDLDWGQDLRRLEEWGRGRAPWVAVIRSRGREVDIPGARPLVSTAPSEVTGWVAVGATPLTVSARDELAWLRKYCPVDTIGGSILIYRFAEAPTAAPGPDMPAAPCPSDRRYSALAPY